VDIEASARKHGVSDDNMLQAIRHDWRGFETDDPDVTMFRPRAASRWKSALSMMPTVLRSSMRCRLDPSS
jgi:hypothetical protein